MKALARGLVALPVLAIALAAGAPAYAGTIVEGQVGQNLSGVASNLYSSGAQDGSAASDIINWSFTCATCAGYGISANGAATVNNGSLGASSSITVTGTPGGPLYGTAQSDAIFTDMLTITGGTSGASGVLELTYMLDGIMSSTGAGFNSSSAYLYMPTAAAYQYDNGGITSGSYVEIDGNGTYNDTVTFYLPFTYGSVLSTELNLDASALFIPTDSTPYTATVNYYNTAALTSALVFDGTPSNPGTQNNEAAIGSADGLTYGPNGITAVTAVPEPSSWLLLASGIGLLAFAKRRGAVRPTL